MAAGVMGYLMNTSIQGAASLLVVTITAPHVSVTFLFLAIFYVHAMNYFRRSNRELQRLDSQGASPLYGHFGETLSGVSTIRGFGAERNMREKNLQMLGGACGPSFYQAVLGCWLKIRLQMVASVIILGVCARARARGGAVRVRAACCVAGLCACARRVAWRRSRGGARRGMPRNNTACVPPMHVRGEDVLERVTTVRGGQGYPPWTRPPNAPRICSGGTWNLQKETLIWGIGDT